MIKTKILRIFKVPIFFLSLFISCGLDDLVYLEPPHFERIQNSEQESEQYIQFRTTDTINLAGYYRGFEIFYRIYASTEDLSNDVSKIKSYNSSNPQAAARWLIDSKKYQKLRRDDKITPIVLTDTDDRQVRVRLYDYGKEKAGLYVENLSPVAQVVRYNGKPFVILDKDNKDADVEQSENVPEEGYKHVAFFTATYGMDEKFVPIYSELLYLGFLALEQ